MPSNDEEYEVLDISGSSGGFNWRRISNRLSNALEKYPTSSRVTIGGIGGCITGYIAKKVGKSAASAVGGGIVLVQVAHKLGYIKFDTRKLNADARRVQERLEHEVRANQSAFDLAISSSQEFIQNNTPYAVGFAAGFFLGLAA